MSKVKYVCTKCGSDHVSLDTEAVWNVETQCWVICSTFSGFCYPCDDQNDLEPKETPND